MILGRFCADSGRLLVSEGNGHDVAIPYWPSESQIRLTLKGWAQARSVARFTHCPCGANIYEPAERDGGCPRCEGVN